MSAQDIIEALTQYVDGDLDKDLDVINLSLAFEFGCPSTKDELLCELENYDV